MKLLSFRVNDKNKYGLATADGVIDLQARFPQYGSLLEFIPHLHLVDTLPAVMIQNENNELRYLLSLVRGGKTLSEGDWYGIIRFMVTYQ